MQTNTFVFYLERHSINFDSIAFWIFSFLTASIIAIYGMAIFSRIILIEYKYREAIIRLIVSFFLI